MKKIYLFAATALLFAACSNESDFKQEAKTVEAPQAVMFDTYTADATRAGSPTGVMTTTTLRTSGFGVFAFYTNAANYPAPNNSLAPNFMYNQEVTSASPGWTYSPLKYWPNETVHDSQSPAATGPTGVVNADKLSFFAYAPYVSAGAGTEGITAMSANDATADPTITYAVSALPENSVDLLWGVAPSGNLTYTSVAGAEISKTAGLPLKDLVKPSKDQKIKFLFKHALSRIGLSVVGAFDQIAAGGTFNNAETKITVTQIDIYGQDQLGVSGTLNLNNTSAGVANWTSITKHSTTSPVFTILNAVLNDEIKDAGDVAFASQPVGVTTSAKNVFQDATKYFMVIPTGSTEITVRIKYYVQTKDTKLAATGSVDGSRIENDITKTITVNLENNKAYNLKLILGMTSVKLDAEVADWEVAGDVDVNLPRNNE